MTTRFVTFAPHDTKEYYTEDHDPKYLTPITITNMPRVFKVRTEKENKGETHPAIALFKHHLTNKLIQPQAAAFLVKGYGIIPAENLICEGEMYYEPFQRGSGSSGVGNKIKSSATGPVSGSVPVPHINLIKEAEKEAGKEVTRKVLQGSKTFGDDLETIDQTFNEGITGIGEIVEDLALI